MSGNSGVSGKVLIAKKPRRMGVNATRLQQARRLCTHAAPPLHARSAASRKLPTSHAHAAFRLQVGARGRSATERGARGHTAAAGPDSCWRFHRATRGSQSVAARTESGSTSKPTMREPVKESSRWNLITKRRWLYR